MPKIMDNDLLTYNGADNVIVYHSADNTVQLDVQFTEERL